jgi:hypothetical protein
MECALVPGQALLSTWHVLVLLSYWVMTKLYLPGTIINSIQMRKLIHEETKVTLGHTASHWEKRIPTPEHLRQEDWHLFHWDMWGLVRVWADTGKEGRRPPLRKLMSGSLFSFQWWHGHHLSEMGWNRLGSMKKVVYNFSSHSSCKKE